MRCKFGRTVCPEEAGQGLYGNFCGTHADYLASIGYALGTRKRPREVVKADTDLTRQAEPVAEALARIVWSESQPVQRVVERLGVHDESRVYTRAAALATQRGHVIMKPGRGFVRGETPPPGFIGEGHGTPEKHVPARAHALARYIHAVDRPVSPEDAAQALGVSPAGGLQGVLRYAREREWIKPGPRGGYVPGRTSLTA